MKVLSLFLLAIIAFPFITFAAAPVDVMYHETIHQADVNDFGNFSPVTSVGELMQKILTILLSLLGSIALLAMIVGGVMMMSDGIDDGKAKKGKQIVLYSAIGVVVALSSLVIVTLAQSFFYYFGT